MDEVVYSNLQIFYGQKREITSQFDNGNCTNEL